MPTMVSQAPFQEHHSYAAVVTQGQLQIPRLHYRISGTLLIYP